VIGTQPAFGFIAKDIGNDTAYFGISAFHGTHCLDTLRRIFEVQFDVASPATINKLQANTSFYNIHHCLIYLQSMILCDADPTLEHDIYSKNGSKTSGIIKGTMFPSDVSKVRPPEWSFSSCRRL
jgi:cold shock CspA family protein